MRKLALALLLLVGCQRGSDAPKSSSVPEPKGPPKDLVKLSLVSDGAAVVPGQTFTLAARFEIQDEWHIYWRNPGEAGLPTEVAFTAPDGFTVGEVRYPGPITFDGEGGVTSFGYEKETLLLAEVTAPEQPNAETVTFSVKAKWLACRESCILGKGTANLELPVGEEAAPTHQALFAAHRERLPRPFDELSGARAESNPHERGLEVVLTVPGAEHLVFYPGNARRLDHTAEAGTVRAVVAPEGDRPPEKLEGVLEVRTQGRTPYHHVTVPWPQAA